jgi:hypothetical protein
MKWYTTTNPTITSNWHITVKQKWHKEQMAAAPTVLSDVDVLKSMHKGLETYKTERQLAQEHEILAAI